MCRLSFSFDAEAALVRCHLRLEGELKQVSLENLLQFRSELPIRERNDHTALLRRAHGECMAREGPHSLAPLDLRSASGRRLQRDFIRIMTRHPVRGAAGTPRAALINIVFDFSEGSAKAIIDGNELEGLPRHSVSSRPSSALSGASTPSPRPQSSMAEQEGSEPRSLASSLKLGEHTRSRLRGADSSSSLRALRVHLRVRGLWLRPPMPYPQDERLTLQEMLNESSRASRPERKSSLEGPLSASEASANWTWRWQALRPTRQSAA